MDHDKESYRAQVNRINTCERYIDLDNERLKDISLLLYILVSYSTSSEKGVTKKLEKLLLRFRTSDGVFRNLACKSLIKYLEICKKDNISFNLDINAIDKILRYNKDEYDKDFLKCLEAAKKGSHYHIEDRIIDLCQEYLKITKDIKNYNNELKQLYKELKKFEEEHYESSSKYEKEVSYTTPLRDKKKEKEKEELEVVKKDRKNQQYTTPITKEQESGDEYTTDAKIVKESLKKFSITLPNLSGTIDSIIEAYKLLNENLKDPYPGDILDLALIIQEILPAYVECRHLLEFNPTLRDFFEKYDVENLFNKYMKLYDKYMKKYEFMSNSKKEEENYAMNTYYKKVEYMYKFGKEDFSSPYGCMLTPDELRRFVNIKITNDIGSMTSGELSAYFYEDYDFSTSHIPPLYNVTMFMNKDEMANLYHVIVDKWNDPFSYSEIAEASLRRFQARYVSLLVKTIYPNETYSLREEELKAFIDEKYDRICNDVLGEESLKRKVTYK